MKLSATVEIVEDRLQKLERSNERGEWALWYLHDVKELLIELRKFEELTCDEDRIEAIEQRVALLDNREAMRPMIEACLEWGRHWVGNDDAAEAAHRAIREYQEKAGKGH